MVFLPLWRPDTPTAEKAKVQNSIYKYGCLKVLELVGFVGCRYDMELGLCVITNAMSLDPHDVSASEDGCDLRTPKRKLAARNRARQLARHVLLGVEFVILTFHWEPH